MKKAACQHSRFDPTKNIFAVGDIHGCFDRLERLLGLIPLDRERDTLVCLGDYIDRGPDSRRVIDLLCRLRAEGVRLVTLMGNHEHLLLEYHRRADRRLVPFMRSLGSESTMESYACTLDGLQSLDCLPAGHREFLTGLLPFWETPDYLFVHAGIRPGVPLEEQTPADLFEARELFLAAPEDFGRTIVFGHTPFETPLVTPGKIGIDTGAVYGNLLTAVELPARRFYYA